ncbi:hypothetical protein ABWL39_06835 [Chitinivorax sp. PXF-14]|uniref:hypothetical protein n=1 Tax=Chitinivorax sp. PXF-14 TaxID=3230488 RepID=UPI00346643A3
MPTSRFSTSRLARCCHGLLLGGLVSLGGLAACSSTAPVHAYEGDKRAEQSLALLTATQSGPAGLEFYSIDGRVYGSPMGRPLAAYVPPGEHEIVLRWIHEFTPSDYIRSEVVYHLRVAPRQRYTFRFQETVEDQGRRVDFWAEDAASSEHIQPDSSKAF